MNGMDPDGANDLPLTDAARQLLADARMEAEELHHDYIGTEHLTLALARHPSNEILSRLGVEPEKIRLLVAECARPGRPWNGLGPPPWLGPSGERPYTSRTQKAFSFARDSAHNRGHTRLAVEDLIVGVLQERMNIGAEVLMRCGTTLEQAHQLAGEADVS